MKRRFSTSTVVGATACLVVATIATTTAGYATESAPSFPAVTIPAQFETNLDRGLVSAMTNDGVFMSWRLLGSEATGATDTGMNGPDFAVYRDGVKIATVTDSTNFIDTDGSAMSKYAVAPVVNGVELASSSEVSPWAKEFGALPLQRPEGGRTPAGVRFPEGGDYTYSANDMSVADVDGDGVLEYIVKWSPSNAKDNSISGYTGNTIIDTYEADGTLLHRIDLGVNIRSGAHYTQFMVEDFDGDGNAEILVKTAPGTRTIARGKSTPITLPQRDLQAGVSHDDDYRLSADQYADHLAETFKAWTDYPEVRSGEWPATVEDALGIGHRFSSPLSDADAAALVDYYIDVWAPQRNKRNNLRGFEGYVLSGPEYLTAFDGATGAELDTVDYVPARVDGGLRWGDYAGGRIEPGNRADRFLAGVANLDGESISAIFARGYYTRSVVAAYDWDGEDITTRWVADSGFPPTANPFMGGLAWDGDDPELGALASQGFHSLSAADVDLDGRQEIIYGSATVDDDGTLMYSSSAITPPEASSPGIDRKLGHGDAMHVTDITPNNPGLEIYTVHEGAGSAYGWALRDAATGSVLDGEFTGRDTGRGMIGDIDTTRPGYEYWHSTGTGEVPTAGTPGTNFSIRWTPDMTTQIIAGFEEDDADTYEDVRIENGQGEVLRTLEGTRSNNSNKGTPGLAADVLGDWREELLVRDVESSEIRIYMATDLTDRKLTTLLHDPQYRVEVARQNTTYNQPSYTSYMLTSDIDYADVPVYTTPVTPTAPEFVEKPGRGQDGYTIPEAERVTYYVDGKPAAAGFYRENRTVKITAIADPWYRTDGTSAWSHTFRAGR